jgi:hypothetical protein
MIGAPLVRETRAIPRASSRHVYGGTIVAPRPAR